MTPIAAPATETAAPSALDRLAVALGCTRKQLPGRLTFLGYTRPCGRCGGSGQFSYCRSHGTRCFDCGGSGKRLAVMTVRMVREAQARIAAGELAPYLAKAAAVNAARRSVEPAAKAVWAAWSAGVGAEYMVPSRRGLDLDAFVTSPLFNANSLAGDCATTASDACSDAKYGKITYLRAAEIVADCAEIMAAVDAAWAAWKADGNPAY